MLLAFTTVSAVLGQSTLRGMTALFIGMAMGWWASTRSPARCATPPACRSSSTASRWCWSRSACSRSARRCTPRCTKAAQRTQNRMSKVHMTRRGMAALVAGVAARHRDRLPVRSHPGRRLRDPDLPQLRDGAQAVEAPRGVRHDGRHRGRGRAGGGQQRGRDRHAGAAADAGHPDVGHRGDPAVCAAELRHPARAAALHRTRRPWCGR